MILSQTAQKEIIEAITNATPQGIASGVVAVEFSISDGSIRNIKIKTETFINKK
jgi:hypothetical protein